MKIPSITTLTSQGLSLWQAGEFRRVMMLADAEEMRGNYPESRKLRGLAINAGNLKKFEVLR